MNNLDALSHWKTGELVKGVYCGVPFEGELTDRCRWTPDYKNVIFVVWLDKPIIVYGQTREVIEVCTRDNVAQIERI